ncbi:MAG: hypothetical protein IBJ00_06170, partial [Alphaproteobacteria bacterium]|nr:hypothetical protein [Alphaproteobacteria bacterium]
PNQWNTLLYELFVSCFDYLSFRELGTAKLVCKDWSTVAKDETLSVEHQYFKRSYATLLRKIDNNHKVQEHVKEMISNYVVKGNITWQFDTIPDFLYKSLLAPSAIAQVLRTPELMAPLFESPIRASDIYSALHQPLLDEDQRVAIESYSRLGSVLMWKGNIFSKEFLNYTSLYRPTYKALYLLALCQLPSGSPIYSLVNMVFHKLSILQTYPAKYENQVLWLPEAMMYLEISPIDSYKISAFCYRWAINSSSSTFQKLWQRYEELFLFNAALGNISEAQFRLGLINYHKGDYHKAELFLRQAASQAHTNAQYKLGTLFLEQGRQQEAKLLFEQAALKGNLVAYFVLAKFWFHQGYLEEAKSSFRQVAEQANGKVLYGLAQLLEKNFHHQSLELFYRQIVSYAPFAQQQVLSTLLLSKNDLRQINSFYCQVLNYGKADIQDHLANLLNKRGNTILAEILLQKIIDKQRS